MDKAIAISSAANAWKSIAAKPDREHHHHHTRLELWRKPVRKEDVLEMQEELCKLPVFAQCIHSMEFLKSLARRVRIKTFSEGQLILGQGMPGKELILIRRGVALMYLADVQIDRVNAGHYIGETNFLGLEDTWKVDLRAERLCVVAALDRDDFFEVLEVFPHLEAYYAGITANHVSCRQDGTLCEPCEIFRDLSESSLVSLDSRVLNRLYFDNEKMMEQGVQGDALYILVRGQVNIEIAGRAVRSDARNADMKYTSETISTGTFKVSNRTEPACFGELGFLGISDKRSATMRAVQVTQVRILHRLVFAKTLEEHAEGLHTDTMAKFLGRSWCGDVSHLESPESQAATILLGLEMFKKLGCSAPFLDFLSQSLEERLFLSGQKIVIENHADDASAYILTSGKAKFVVGGEDIRELHRGELFGEQVLFGTGTTRSSTVVALTTCQAQVLHQSIVIKGLELFPEERQRVLTFAFAKMEEVAGAAEPSSRRTSVYYASPEELKNAELRAVMKAVKSSEIMGNLPGDFAEELKLVAVSRIYMPGEIIIKQGTKYDSMFIMVSGCAGVYIADTHDSQGEPYEAGPVSKVGTLAEGSISGELSMLGVSSVRCATVQAETICCMWEIHHDSAVSIINRMPDVRQQFAQIVIQHLQSAIPNLIDTLPLFRNFDRKFRMLLGLYCDPCAYFSGQQIFSEGQQGRGLCIINSGRAMLERKSITLKTYSPGMHFNSTIMLGVHQNSFCSLVAFKTCHVAFISRSSYLQALDSYPSHNAAAQLLRTECAEHEDFKKQIHRLCLRTRSWKKAMMMLHEDSIQSGQDADHKSSSLYAKLSSCPGLAHKPFSSVFSHSDTENARNEDNEEILKTQAWTSWIKYVQQRKLQRSTSEKRKVINAEWVAKKKDAIARRKHKDDERERAVAFKPERKRRTGAKRVCASRPSSKETASRPTTKDGLLPLQARPVTAPSAFTACVSTQPAGLDEGLPPLVSSPPPVHLIPTDLTLVKKHMATERKISTDLTSLKKSVVLSEDSKFSAKSSSILEERWNETSSIYIKWRAKKPANYFKLSRR